MNAVYSTTQRRQASKADVAPAKSHTAPAGGMPHYLSGVRSVPVFPHLHVSDPSDAAEVEADRLADQMTGGQEPCGACASGGPPCPKCAAQSIQRKATAGAAPKHWIPEHRVGGLGIGHRLPESALAQAEGHLGIGLDRVRIHTGPRAATAARSIHARAFTRGSDIVFDEGEYQPETPHGMRLLAHELAHVAQQGDSASSDLVQRVYGPTLEPQQDATAGTQPFLSDNLLHAAPPARAIGQYARVGPVNPFLILRSSMDTRKFDTENPAWALVRWLDPLIAGVLNFNDRLYVVEEFAQGWVRVRTDAGKEGYVNKSHLFIGAPEPEAVLYQIQPGDTALGVAQRAYSCGEWGKDGRFFVNVLVHVNKGEGNSDKGIYKEKEDGSWKSTHLRAGYYMWLPSEKFARSLAGVVSSGSITYELWQGIKGFVGFIIGLVEGFIKSLWDIVTGVVELVGAIVDFIVDLVRDGIRAKLSEIRDFIKRLDVEEIASSLWSDFKKKWFAEDGYDRWHFRGYVIGYVVAEIAVAVLTAGAVTGAKWAGKVGKLAKLAARLEDLGSIKGLKKTLGRAVETRKDLRAMRSSLQASSDAVDSVTTTGARNLPPAPHGAGSAGSAWDWDANTPTTRKWQAGDPIDMPDAKGQYPSYDGVARPRYWKNRAHFELEARRRGEVTFDPNHKSDPIRKMSDDDLAQTIRTGQAPRHPTTGRTMELEHVGVPQRVVTQLEELGFSPEEARRIAKASSPNSLFEVEPLEHAFFDAVAQKPDFLPRPVPGRLDADGNTWKWTRLGDERLNRVLARMDDATIMRILNDARTRGLDFSRTARTGALRDALRLEISARGLLVAPP